MMWTVKNLRAFSKIVARFFEQKKIRGPIHLCGDNEAQLIRIFKQIKKEDWVFSTHRNSYHYLLKGGNPEWLLQEICAGRSMHIYDKRINFLTSAILSGCCAIAVGVAYGLKMCGIKAKVYCFIGDGATDSGRFFEALRFVKALDLLITFIVEDNDFSVDTPKSVRWQGEMEYPYYSGAHIIHYSYKRKYPHTGIGKWITF